MTLEQLKAMLTAAGVNVAAMKADDLGSLLKSMNESVSMEEKVRLLVTIAKEQIEASLKPISDRLNAIQSGEMKDNGVPGSGNREKAGFRYVEASAEDYSSVPGPRRGPADSRRIIVPQCVQVGKELEATFAHIRRAAAHAQPFRFNSGIDPDFKAMSVADPSDAGLTLPPAFEEAMVDTYIAASGWLNSVRTIRGSSKQFYYLQRSRELDVTKRPKTLTAIVAKMIGEGGTPVKTENSPWGFVKGEARTYACYGKITREMLRGVPGSVNDFMQEMTRGIGDIMSYDAAWGEGNPKNEVLGFINQVDAKFKAIRQKRTVADHIVRDDLINMIEALHDYFKPGAFWMGRSQTVLDLAREKDDQNRPLFNNFSQDISRSVEGFPLLGYPVVNNWQSPFLGDEGDLCLISPQALWVFFQEALTIRSSEHVEFLEGNLHIVADVGWNAGVSQNKGIIVLDDDVLA